MDQAQFDYAFAGAGAAGLQVILKMIDDPFFADKSILIIEKNEKKANDRTWSFWENKPSIWDDLAINSWGKGQFINQKGTINFHLAPYTYKTVRSADFYAYAKTKIEAAKNITWVADRVISIEGQEIIGEKGQYAVGHIFDSRVSPEFEAKKDDYHSLIQHFRGWFIKTPNPVFDPQNFVMMDYRLKWNDSTSFTYVLPFSETTALVEFTLFNQQLLDIPTYEGYLRQYLKEYLKIEEYEIEEIEHGAIPMSDYPFHKHHTKHVTKIGTAGGWVRPSSGYSFKNADRYSDRLIANIKKGLRPEKGIATTRFRLYDSIFLNVLSSRNDLGEEIFTRLYTKPHIQSVFRFLDEESTISEDLRVMFSLNRPQFWKAFIQTFYR